MQIIVASSHLFRRELSSFILSEAGYDVHEVSDSAALRECLQAIQPDLILLDMRLNEIDDSDTTELLQHHAQGVPVVVMTSHSTLLDSVSLAAGTPQMHINWPYTADDLLAYVSRVLRRGSRTMGATASPVASASMSLN